MHEDICDWEHKITKKKYTKDSVIPHLPKKRDMYTIFYFKKTVRTKGVSNFGYVTVKMIK